MSFYRGINTWIPGFEKKYRIQEDGLIISCLRGYPRAMKPLVDKETGYHKIALIQESPKKYKWFRVHQLVMLAFHGPCPPGHVIDHIDGSKDNNHVTNLRYVTSSENSAKRRNNYSGPKLSKADIKKVCDLKEKGYCNREIAELFDISVRSVQRVWSEHREPIKQCFDPYCYGCAGCL